MYNEIQLFQPDVLRHLRWPVPPTAVIVGIDMAIEGADKTVISQEQPEPRKCSLCGQPVVDGYCRCL
jgi:hypothetical protein